MKSAEAHSLLNLAKQGAKVSRQAILEALSATGDLSPTAKRPAQLPTEPYDFPNFGMSTRRMQDKNVPPLPKIVFKSFALAPKPDE